MPIKKFRDVSEMKRIVYLPGSPQLVAATRHIWSLSRQICPLRFPPGVHRHRSVEDADELRKQWQRENAERQQQRIRSKV
jgi:hypothetical protein